MSTFEQTLNAGVPVTFPGGEQFHLLEADEPVDVTFYDNRNRPIEIWESMKGGFRHTIEEGFIQVRLESAIGQTVKIALTSGRGQYDRSQGDVNILNIAKDNSWYYDTAQKNTFIGSGNYSAGIDGIAAIQLWNPNASGKNLLCNRIHIMTDATALKTLKIAHYGTALGFNGIQGNKYLAEAAGVALIKKESYSVAVGTDIAEIPTQPNILIDIPINPPIEISQNSSLLVSIEENSKKLYAAFQWTEIPA